MFNLTNDFKQDPFYQLQNRGTDFFETSSAYVLKTRVPEFEKDKIKVKIHDDRVMVQGTRSFQDKREESDRKIATNNFQTFKEEFKFDKPVAIGASERSQSGDELTVVIPKLSSVEK